MNARLALAVAAFAAIHTSAIADEVVLEPSHDTSIYESSGTVSNGAGGYLFSGRTNTSGLRRALVRFDLSSIPSGSTITAASLSVSLSLTVGGVGPASLHRVLEAWGEAGSDAGLNGGMGAPAATGDATWSHRVFPGDTWSVPGGAIAASASMTTSMDTLAGSKVFASTPEAVADVQSWLDAPQFNFGWALLCDETVVGNARRFASREHPDPALRPKLTITFSRPSECLADFNRSGSVTVQDIFDFLAAYFSNDPRADVNGSSSVTVQDIFDFLSAYFAGCV